MADYKFIDNSKEAKRWMDERVQTALEGVGAFVQNQATKELENDPHRVDTGRLRGSIEYTVTNMDGKDVAIVGTNVYYSVYVHEGTGKYHPQGRPIPWVYRDEKGKWHRTAGMKPNRFLKNAIVKNEDQIKKYLKDNIVK